MSRQLLKSLQLCCVCFSLFSMLVQAAAVEQRNVGERYRDQGQSTAQGSDQKWQTNDVYDNGNPQAGAASDPLWEMVNQLQVLESEVLELRGTIDQQAYEIDQLKNQQKQHYVDLDQRIEMLSGGESKKNYSSKVASTSNQSTPNQSQPKSKSTLDDAEIKRIYSRATSDIRSRDFPQAEDHLNKILNAGYEGYYLPLAHYWLAEVLIAKANPDLSRATSHFETVIQKYPDNSKVPPSMYKLGTLLFSDGDTVAGARLLKELIQNYPGSSEAKMASDYLDQYR